jgi:hypothetical protein
MAHSAGDVAFGIILSLLVSFEAKKMVIHALGRAAHSEQTSQLLDNTLLFRARWIISGACAF